MNKNLDTLEIKLFKFNHSVDYLPYYKTYNIEYTQDESIFDILNKINSYESFSYESFEKCNVKINNYFFSADILVSDVVNKVGNELQVEPISLYRVTNDLIIDTKDYDEKIELFDSFLTKEEKNTYREKYKLEYYSSLSMIINKEYIGDHCLLIANDILEKNAIHEKAILDIITNKDTGILYHTSLKARLFQNKYDVESVYEKLLSKIKTYKNLQNSVRKKSDINEDIEITQYFKGFNIALYNKEGCLFRKVISKSRATYLHLDSRRYDLAFNSSLVNKEFSLKIAGEVLLEAKDKNADFLIVKDEADLAIFDAKQRKIETIINREIKLPVITQKEFEMLLLGEKDTSKIGLDKHKVKVEFI